MGFLSEYGIDRWTLRRTITATAGTPRRQEVLTSLTHSLAETDREAFGANRTFLLQSLHHDAPEFTMENRSSNTLQCYALRRHGSFADHLGPWIAETSSSARHLLEQFLCRSNRATLIVDCLKQNNMAITLLKSFGFTCSRGLTRMYRGTNIYQGRPDMLCAILGTEFG